MADLNGTVSGGQKITGTVEPQAQKLRGALRLGGGGGVTDVWQNGESVLDGTIGKVTVPTNTSDLTNDSGFITTETDPVFGASPAKNITASNISTWNGKQDALVSGTNIKTINNTSLLGSGNIDIQGGGGGDTVTYTQTVSSGTKLGDININGTPNTVYTPTIPTNVSSFTNDAGYLTSHQNIKTINSTSMVGTGNVSVQPTLVSGTNIKTINSTSLLGSGNISVQSAITQTSTTISVANWNATTTCTKSVTGVTSSNGVIVTPAPASISTWTSNGVYCSAQGSGTLTFTCSTTPSADITVNIMIVG